MYTHSYYKLNVGTFALYAILNVHVFGTDWLFNFSLISCKIKLIIIQIYIMSNDQDAKNPLYKGGSPDDACVHRCQK